MAVTKSLHTKSLIIEVQSCIDKAGDPIYTKKTFSNVKTDSAGQGIYTVTEAIKAVM